eukprot:861081-Pelagomonas_calceolata.AAC.4
MFPVRSSSVRQCVFGLMFTLRQRLAGAGLFFFWESFCPPCEIQVCTHTAKCPEGATSKSGAVHPGGAPATYNGSCAEALRPVTRAGQKWSTHKTWTGKNRTIRASIIMAGLLCSASLGRLCVMDCAKEGDYK